MVISMAIITAMFMVKHRRRAPHPRKSMCQVKQRQLLLAPSTPVPCIQKYGRTIPAIAPSAA